jgi:RNA polymerase-binding transcription factor DksA
MAAKAKNKPKPATKKSVAKAKSKPAAKKPAAKAKPATKKPVAKAKSKPTAKKPVAKSKSKPATKKPVAKAKSKPVAKKPVAKSKSKPATKKPVAKAKSKLVAKKPVAKSKSKPATKKPVAKAKLVAKKPVKTAKSKPVVKAKPEKKIDLAKAKKIEKSTKKADKKSSITSGKTLKKEGKKIIDDKDLEIPVDDISVKAVFGDDLPDDIDEDDDVVVPVAPTAKPSRRSRRKPPKFAPISPGPQTITPAKPKPLIEKKNIPQPVYKPENKSFIKKETGKMDNRSRYSDNELNEFKELIEKKLAAAKSDYESLKSTLSYKDHHGTDDTYATFKMMEDGSETLSREEVSQLAIRQEKFIQNLEHALIRVKNKTYGICRVTGKLIPKERLRAVPHATLSIEAKEQMNR